MSAEALADIQKILEKHRISAKLTTWYKDGEIVTKIILKGSAVSAGSQSKTPPGSLAKTKKSKKSPSRLRRDATRRMAHEAKVAGSCDKDHGAAVQEPVPQSTQTNRRHAGFQNRVVDWGHRQKSCSGDQLFLHHL